MKVAKQLIRILNFSCCLSQYVPCPHNSWLSFCALTSCFYLDSWPLSYLIQWSSQLLNLWVIRCTNLSVISFILINLVTKYCGFGGWFLICNNGTSLQYNGCAMNCLSKLCCYTPDSMVDAPQLHHLNA